MSVVISCAFGSILPYASSYNAHTVNHAIATPVVQPAPLVATAPVPAFIPRLAGPAVIPPHVIGTPFAALSAPLISPFVSSALGPYNYNVHPYIL